MLFLVYCALSCTAPMNELCCTVLPIVFRSQVYGVLLALRIQVQCPISITGLRSPGTVLFFLLRSHVVECTQVFCVLKCTELSSVYMLSNVQYCALKCNMLSSVQYCALKCSTTIFGFCDLRCLAPKLVLLSTRLYWARKCRVLFRYYSLKCPVLYGSWAKSTLS